jgi:hypothetical protein
MGWNDYLMMGYNLKCKRCGKWYPDDEGWDDNEYGEVCPMCYAERREYSRTTRHRPRGGVMGWISVKDRLPEEWKMVLTWDIRRGVCKGLWFKRNDMADGEYWNIDGTSGGFGSSLWVYPPTHWMPLPDPPECHDKNHAKNEP